LNIELFDGLPPLVTVSKEQIEKITNRLPEYHRGSALIGHSTSHTSASLQSVHMINDSPLSKMKQCLAQIDKKYKALQEAYFKIENMKLEIDELSKTNDKKSSLKIRENEAIISNMSSLMENALRQIGMYQDMYESIMKNNNIPENWTEKDYEKQEIMHMVKSSFRIAIQDLTAHGRVSRAAVEYWEQLGIHPQVGEIRTREYLVKTQELINKNKTVSVELMYDFLDRMHDEFKDCYKLALMRTGLDEVGSEYFMATGETRQ
jgi:hypothetical protein